MSRGRGVTFGALAPPLAEQLAGIEGLSDHEVARLQLKADAVVQLCVGGFLTEAEATRARKRIIRDMVRTVEAAS